MFAAILFLAAQVAHEPEEKPPVTRDDIRIVERAKQILDTPAKWNRADNRVCPADAKTFSIYCALEKATRDVTGEFAHRASAMQEARFVIDAVAANRPNYHHRLMDYNNDPSTTFDDVQRFFQLLEDRLRGELALQHSFRELDDMCARDAGKMWGRSLCGPTLFVDPKTRAVVANQMTPEAVLPPEIGIANTSIDWGGKKWTMVMLPLPSNDYDRRVLLVHESFHRIQKDLGLWGEGKEGDNAHLDTLEGRVWMQMEWRALAAALQGDRDALSDALAYRAKRQSLFPQAAEEEKALETREGLAEYTGTRFAEPDLAKRIPHLIEALREAEKKPTFVRSFAYVSGPAWGAIREMYSVPSVPSVVQNLEKYDYRDLLASEKAREEKKQAMLADFRARFLDGPTLVLPLKKFTFEMDPNTSIPFESYGTVFPTLTLRDAWGTIVVKRGGALISSDWTKLILPFPLTTDYELTLK